MLTRRTLAAGLALRAKTAGAVIHRRVFRFEGEIVGAGVHWPPRLTIAQDGKSYVDPTLSTFDAGPA